DAVRDDAVDLLRAHHRRGDVTGGLGPGLGPGLDLGLRLGLATRRSARSGEPGVFGRLLNALHQRVDDAVAGLDARAHEREADRAWHPTQRASGGERGRDHVEGLGDRGRTKTFGARIVAVTGREQ